MIDWDLALAMGSEYDADGFPSVQVDAYGEQDSGVAAYEQHHTHGFMSRPLDPVVDSHGTPDPTQSNTVLQGMEGGKGHVMPLENPAVVQKLPIAKKGEAFMYGAPHAQFVRMHDDGHISAWVPGKDGPDTVLTLDDGSFAVTGPQGTLKFDMSGLHVVTASGARVDLGGIYGIPGFDAVTSYASIQAGSFDVEATAVSMGADPSSGAKPHAPLASAPVAASMFSEIFIALQALKLAVSGLCDATGTVALMAPVEVAMVACSSLASALTTLPTNATASG